MSGEVSVYSRAASRLKPDAVAGRGDCIRTWRRRLAPAVWTASRAAGGLTRTLLITGFGSCSKRMETNREGGAMMSSRSRARPVRHWGTALAGPRSNAPSWTFRDGTNGQIMDRRSADA